MEIALKPSIRKFVEAKVASGQFGSTDEAVNELLAFAKKQQELSPEVIEELRAAVDEAQAEVDRGESAEFDLKEFLARKRRELAARKKRP